MYLYQIVEIIPNSTYCKTPCVESQKFVSVSIFLYFYGRTKRGSFSDTNIIPDETNAIHQEIQGGNLPSKFYIALRKRARMGGKIEKPKRESI